MRCFAIVVLAAVLSPFAAPAAEPDAESIQRKLNEFREIEKRLDALRQAALANPEIAEEGKKLRERVEAKMKEKNPAIGGELERFKAMRAKLGKAAAAGDQARTKRLNPEFEKLSKILSSAQGEALRSKDLAKHLEAFERRLRAEMARLDPESDAHHQRLGTLAAQLQATMGSTRGSGPTRQTAPQTTGNSSDQK